MKYFLAVYTLFLVGCQSTLQTTCARKAEIIAASQAVIDALNEYCPIDNENGSDEE